MGTAAYTEQQSVLFERRQAKLERDRARKQAREAKRALVVTDNLRSLGALVRNAQEQEPAKRRTPSRSPSMRAPRTAPVSEPAVVNASATAAALETLAGSGRCSVEDYGKRLDVAIDQMLSRERSTQSPSPRTPTGATATEVGRRSRNHKGNAFAERRQREADRARDLATRLVEDATERLRDRRGAERSVARAMLAALSNSEARGPLSQLFEALAADDPRAVRKTARRALWRAAADAANGPAPATARVTCTALAVIEWLPVSAIRAARKLDSTGRPGPISA